MIAMWHHFSCNETLTFSHFHGHVIWLQKCIACLELEVSLLKALHNTASLSHSPKRRAATINKSRRELFFSLTASPAPASAQTNSPKSQSSELLGNLLFYNIVILEAMKGPLKQTSPNSADCEHIACNSLWFLTLTLDYFAESLLEVRAAVSLRQSGETAKSSRVLEFLKGPYLAQLIQSCLQFSQHRWGRLRSVCLRLTPFCLLRYTALTFTLHVCCIGVCCNERSKTLAAAALATLHAVLHCTFGAIFDPPSPLTPASDPPRAAVAGAGVDAAAAGAAAVEWRAFYPGILGGLYAICRTGHKR
jgi:hypothetical protein